MTTSRISPSRTRLLELADAQLVRSDAVHRRERAAEHVVQPMELAAALDREHIERFLNNT